ncbi:hypothetical protein VDGL01_02710 [Verticillium dahliae]
MRTCAPRPWNQTTRKAWGPSFVHRLAQRVDREAASDVGGLLYSRDREDECDRVALRLNGPHDDCSFVCQRQAISVVPWGCQGRPGAARVATAATTLKDPDPTSGSSMPPLDILDTASLPNGQQRRMCVLTHVDICGWRAGGQPPPFSVDSVDI